LGTLTVDHFVTNARYVLMDAMDANVRWENAELIAWAGAAAREIATLDTSANKVTGLVDLVVGTRQTMPASAIAVGTLVRNMGPSGNAPGRAPRLVAASLMADHSPDWHASPPGSEVRNYMVDPARPRDFYVWPPLSAPTKVLAEYPALPAPVSGLNDLMPIPDFYEPAVLSYMLWRAFSKDAELARMQERAAGHRAEFDRIMAGADAAETSEARPA